MSRKKEKERERERCRSIDQISPVNYFYRMTRLSHKRDYNINLIESDHLFDSLISVLYYIHPKKENIHRKMYYSISISFGFHHVITHRIHQFPLYSP